MIQILVLLLRYPILCYTIIHLVPVLRGFRIMRVFSGTKMRVMRGLGYFDAVVVFVTSQTLLFRLALAIL